MGEIIFSRCGAVVCVVLCFFLASCKTQSESSVLISSLDAAKVGEYARLPLPVSAAEWKVVRVGDIGLGPSDMALIAKLQFRDENAYSLLAGADTSMFRCGMPESLFGEWKDKDVIGSFKRVRDEIGVQRVSDRTCYDAHAFAKGSFSDGFYVILDDKKSILLYLGTN